MASSLLKPSSTKRDSSRDAIDNGDEPTINSRRSTMDAPPGRHELFSGHHIIQCPQCQTKFAVAPELVLAIESPRFHCSRCDHVFSVEGLPTSEDLAPPHESAEETLESLHEDARSLGLARQDEEDFTAVTETSFRTDEVTQSGTFEAITPVNSTPVNSVNEQEEQLIGAYRDEPSEEVFPVTDLRTLDMSVAPTLHAEIANESPATPNAPLYPETSATELSEAVAVYSSWRSAGMVLAPIGFAFVVLLVISIQLRASPESASQLFASMFPNTRLAAPATLFVRDTQVKKILLDSGETVFMVTGMLTNSSANEAIHEPEIEAALFDNSGSLIGREKALASTTLAQSQLSALTPEMIKAYQKQPSRHTRTLKPGENAEFGLVLMGPAAQKARYFTARVYSVR